jgi:DNA-binding transcriptional ArsR family regulator
MTALRSHRSDVELDTVASALGDSTRRAILRLVRDDERSAGSLADEFPAISRPAVSQHLKVLTGAGLVMSRRDGRHHLFRARPEGMADMRAFLDEMWSDRLAKLKIAAEQVEWAERQRRAMGVNTPNVREGNPP